MKLQTQANSTIMKRVLVTVTVVAVGLGITACSSGEDSAHNSILQKKGYTAERQAGSAETSVRSKLAELAKERGKVQKNVDELTRKIDNIQQDWNMIRYADPQYKAPIKDRQEMMNLVAERDKQALKLKQIEKQIKALGGQ